MDKFNVILQNLIKNIIFYKKEIIIRTIKIIDIGYIFTFYAIAGFLISIILDKLFHKYNDFEYNKKTTKKILLEVSLIFSVIGIIVYITKNLFEIIPFPLDGLYGYKHIRTKEINTAVPLTYTILFFQNGLQNKLNNLAKRYFI